MHSSTCSSTHTWYALTTCVYYHRTVTCSAVRALYTFSFAGKGAIQGKVKVLYCTCACHVHVSICPMCVFVCECVFVCVSVCESVCVWECECVCV